MTTTKRVWIALLLVALLLLAACGEKDKDDNTLESAAVATLATGEKSSEKADADGTGDSDRSDPQGSAETKAPEMQPGSDSPENVPLQTLAESGEDMENTPQPTIPESGEDLG